MHEDPAEAVADLPADCHHVIMTHNHQMDYSILKAILKRGDPRYVGPIGSETKWRRFQMRFEHQGYSPEFYQSTRCPVGLSQVPGKLPVEVAVSIAGELIGLNHAEDQAVATQQGVNWREMKKVLSVTEEIATEEVVSKETSTEEKGEPRTAG